MKQAIDGIENNDWISLDSTTKTINFTMKNTIDNMKSADSTLSMLVSNCGVYPEVTATDSTNPLAANGRIYLNFKVK